MGVRNFDGEWIATGVLSTAHSAQHFYSSLLPPLIPVLTVALALPLWQLGLLVSLHSLVSGFGQAPMGVLSDRYDRRFLSAPGLGVMGLGYVAFGLAIGARPALPSVAVAGVTFRGPLLAMSGAMVVGGAGSSVVHPTGYPLISANVSADRKRQRRPEGAGARHLGERLEVRRHARADRGGAADPGAHVGSHSAGVGCDRRRLRRPAGCGARSREH